LTNIGKSAQRQNPEEQRHHSFLCFRAPWIRTVIGNIYLRTLKYVSFDHALITSA
jgi:hypothetical protein